ncbi:hypothetical protein DNL40_14235 [Xylanimonas oleitrophica]|uniref:Uncharacterized protein n=1 Tax=Xylanimonas oleitrophica TaxID=2607479 RepID=A0A2W5WLB5_9MICO|nr:hypothetical protein DNL40_14235 [Xylanimonas oleitrophica]
MRGLLRAHLTTEDGTMASTTTRRASGPLVVAPARPDVSAQRRFDLHRTDHIDHSCGVHLV